MKRYLLFFLLLATVANAANFYVKPTASGTGDGSSWTNALGQTFTPVRGTGNTYYIADGNYSSKSWNTAPSSTTIITIKKATAADHGTETGWTSDLGDGQAIYANNWFVGSDYWTFDGGTTVGTYGFKVNGFTGTDTVNPYTIKLWVSGPIPSDNITIRGLEVDMSTSVGNMNAINSTGGGTNLTLDNIKITLCPGDAFAFSDGTSNLIVQNCWVNVRGDSQGVHADAIAFSSSQSNKVIRWNRFDWDGQQIWFDGTGSGVHGPTEVYGNIFFGGPVSGKAVASHSNSSMTGTSLFYNNTVVNLNTEAVGFPPGTFISRNNIYWDCPTPDLGSTHSNNFFETGMNTGGEATAQQTSTSPFVSVAAENYNLSGPTNAGFTLSSPYNVDMNGVTRGADGNWDRGAIEFNSGTDTTRPTLISSIVQSSGTQMIRNFSEAVVTDSGDNASWSITLTNGAVTGVYTTGSGTSAVTYSLSRTVNGGESGTNTYTQPGNGIEDSSPAGNDLLTVTGNITNNSTQGQVAVPVIALAEGAYYGTQSVGVTTPTSGATIHYTLDGSTPDSGDPTVSGGTVSLSSGATLSAIAIKSGSANSPVATATYEINQWASNQDFTSFSVPQQTTTFPWIFRVVPGTTTNGTVIGLSPNVVDAYDDMGVIVRFTQTGTVDARNGANYENSAAFSYSAGTTYDVGVIVNLSAHTYTVTVTPLGGSTTTLLTTGGSANFGFRTEQAAATELDNVGMTADGVGSATVSNMSLAADLVAPTPNPMTFLSVPAAVDAFSITMTATTASDIGGPVEYYFEETTGHAGATDSGWQSSSTYVDSQLSPNTLYTYYVWARDNSLNQTSPSSSFSATTPAVITGARANCETLNVTTLQVAAPPGSAQTTSQFGFTYPAFTGAGGAMTAPQFVTSFGAAMHHPQQYRNWITEGKDIRLLNPAGIYAKHINIRTIYPDDLSHPNHDYVMNVHPEWLLLNGDGNPVSLFVPEEKCVDFANDAYLDWVLNTWLPTEFVDTTDDDSGLTTFYVHDNGNFLAQTITPNCSHSWCAPYKTDAGMQAAWKHMLDRFKARWPNKKILVSTGPVSYQTPAVQLPRFTDVLAHSDGYFSESLTSDHVYWSGQPNDQKRNALETTMQLADWLAVNDKYFFPNLGPGDGIEPTQAEVNYGYAFFNLMRAGTKQFFAMIVKDGSGNWQPEVYPEMTLALGTSLEARTQISTNVYRRRFASATAYVNLSDSSTNITLPVGTNKNSLGATVASPLTLPSFSGLTVYHY